MLPQRQEEGPLCVYLLVLLLSLVLSSPLETGDMLSEQPGALVPPHADGLEQLRPLTSAALVDKCFWEENALHVGRKRPRKGKSSPACTEPRGDSGGDCGP